ncbi:two-component system, OmpR family, phosphate regulon sensor histidine kinase PhoR [Cohaesibacter sp. ES.047]|uniref:ATP-binding protein n=1 Tax=Cohaesibacter sp. ES.047 TaxID=1798205 RepID=UPI000BBFFD90|nr:ATP-binding protein [Cohaesibacter sp. ES.047]SNY91874.1 two-component system, OmpR family, phosphate regulon sensor histidine kinase PhoR [Cohaesibacter sp. ES.047]
MANDKHTPRSGKSYDAEPFMDTGPLLRLYAARWVLLVAVIGLAWITYSTGSEPWRAAVVFAVILFATAFLPRRRKVTRLKARAQARRLTMVPDVHMRKLAAALPDPCFILDRRGIVRFANAPGGTIFGNVKEGDPLSFRIRQPNMLAALDNVLDGGPIEKVEYSLKSHSERVYEAWVTPIHLSAEPMGGARPDFILLLLHDQTEQKNIERMRADFVANASHELRTPLASVIGFIETLQGPAKGDIAATEKFLGIMLDQAERMSRLVSDLLSLSRIEMKAHVLPDTQVDLSKIISHVADALAPLARDQNVTVNMCACDDSRWIAGDRDELVQVFENLVENALKYGQDGEKIDIDCKKIVDPADGQLHYAVSIRDYGQGIPTEHLPRLTERFYRIDVASSRERKGTGLGLAIVKHILTRHRGRLLVNSVSGLGSTFEVRLPVADSDDL